MKHSLLLSLLMFVCLGVFGQSSIVPTKRVSFEPLQSSIITLQDSIQRLKADNADLHKQLDNLEKELERYFVDIKTNTTTSETHISWWLVITSIIITLVITIVTFGLGVIAPLMINRRSEKNVLIAQVQAKHAKRQVIEAQQASKIAGDSALQAKIDAASAKQKAIEAQQAAEAAKEKLTEAQQALNDAQASAAQAQAEAKAAKEDADKVAKVETTVADLATGLKTAAADAEGGFKKAKAIQYFVQALQIQKNDENRAIELYTQCIEEDNIFAEAYNNRGFLRHKIAATGAMEDFSTAIDKKPDYAEAINNRGILYFENREMFKANEDFNVAIALNYAEAYLNRGLLHYKRGEENKAKYDFDNAIAKKSSFAEAYYIRGLFRYSKNDRKGGIADISFAIALKNDVVESYPNRCLLTGKIKDLDNSINEVGFSKDMTKVIIVPKDKKDPFMLLASIKEIGDGAFAGCTKLNEILVDVNNNYYCSMGGVLYSKNMKKLIAFPGGKKSIDIPESVTEIEGFAFNDCTNLQNYI